MTKFALKRLEAVNCNQIVDKLIINDRCQFDDFEAEARRNNIYENEIGMIYSYLEYISNGSTLPNKHFRDITPVKQKVKEYEFKTKNLRVYAIKQTNGKIIIFGGYKNSQKKDIKQFRAIKKRFLEFQKQ
jgi:putative component of toxin-antitoxin plasmid stabilization module